MQQFVNDDLGYLDWLAGHPRGLVVNCFRTPTTDYLKLHRATCHTISGRPATGDTWTERAYGKVCSDDRAPLDRWARDVVGGSLQPCGHCRP